MQKRILLVLRMSFSARLDLCCWNTVEKRWAREVEQGRIRMPGNIDDCLPQSMPHLVSLYRNVFFFQSIQFELHKCIVHTFKAQYKRYDFQCSLVCLCPLCIGSQTYNNEYYFLLKRENLFGGVHFLGHSGFFSALGLLYFISNLYLEGLLQPGMIQKLLL